ncbi:MAG: toll/interleukin-1 receptor domain-containing protein [bacterium]
MGDVTPKAFVSYSWDDDNYKKWVAQLATRLRSDAVEVILDQWHAVPGDQLPEFMEREIRENDYVLIICTPNYKQKSDNRSGGVGYEGDIMTGEIFSKGNHRKFIPILARGTWKDAAPSWLKGKYFIDLNAIHFEQGYNDLLTIVRGTRPKAPPMGKKATDTKNHAPFAEPQRTMPDDPIKILGVIADEVTQPQLNGTPGSALYSVPFRLSRSPSLLWRQFFVKAWNLPPIFTSMHRPGIASVSSDKIILDGTTIEEVEGCHRDTLVLCVNVANDKEKKVIAKQKLIAEQKRKQSAEHKSRIEDISKRIKFD